MANQAIALQARAPQGNFLAPALQQGAQFINMMSQQRAAERQAAVQQQQLDIARTRESREATKAPFELAEAKEKALTAQQKNTLGFYDLVAAGVKNSSTPDQVMIVADFLKKTYPGATQQIDQKLSDMPTDPAGFNAWREKTMLQSLDAKDQLTKEFTTQNLGDSTRVLRTPKFGGGAGEVVPGSEVNLGQEITYVKGPNGEVIPMPKRMAPAGGGLVGGARGGGVTPVATALQTNPGAIRDGGFARSQPGYAGASGGFATFDTPQAGVAAQENLLRGSYVAKGFNTINKIIDRYSPAGGENAPAAVANYKAYVARRAGIDTNAPITAAQVPVVAAAMREFETGQRPTGAPAAAPAAGGGVQFGVPVPGTGGSKPKDLTVQEQTSSYNISRLLRGAAAIKKAVETSPSANVPGATEAVVGSLPFISGAVNFTRGPQRQIVAAAQRDVLDALLYLATGAAYNKEQLEGQMESYIPAFSDAPEAIESKRERLAQLVMDAKTRAGRAWTPKLDEAANTLFGPTAAAAAKAPAATTTASGVKVSNW